MKLFVTLGLFILSIALHGRVAQSQNAFASPLRAAQIAQLQAWAANGKIESASPINLDVRAVDLTATRATEPLQSWVRGGGIVILHTDAAQAFGFSTVQARERTFNRAGQLWGRGGDALPFGGNPLLLGGRSQSRKGQTDGIPGVRTVFYQLQSGDALLVDSGAAVVPLLRVEDNTLPENGKAEPTFYAAAMRRYGKGWALFMPRLIEARADGEQFQVNLQTFIEEANEGKWLTLPVTTIEKAYQSASQQQNPKWEELQNALHPNQSPKTLPGVSEDAQLILSIADADAVYAALEQVKASPNEEGLQSSGRALVNLLAARALWQLDSGNGAPFADAKLAALWGQSSAVRELLWKTQEGGPAATMTRWWNGVFALGAALPPIPTSYQTQLIEFSYARPALEASQWWQGVDATDRTLNVSASKAGQAAQEMAQQHQNDPPLLSYWQTDSGTRYFMQLAPVQAVSQRFPALPQEWGMPLRNNTTRISQFFGQLAPLGSNNAIPLNVVSQPITYSEANSVSAKTFWLCSRYWSGTIPNSWGMSQNQCDVLIEPGLTDLEYDGIVLMETLYYYFPFLKEDRVMLKNYVHRPIPTWEAYLYVQKESGVVKNDRDAQRYFSRYNHEVLAKWLFNLTAVTLTPARVSRLQARLQLQFWLESSATPNWVDDGLQNVFSLEMANIIHRSHNDLSNIRPPAPPSPNTQDGFPPYYWAEKMERAARNYSLAAENPEVEPASTDGGGDRDFDGTSLVELASTRQVSFFYKRFGAGAFVETLQRLGSGQSIDSALLATTGLNQQQFFAAANASWAN